MYRPAPFMRALLTWTIAALAAAGPAHALPEELLVGAMKTPTALSLAVDGAGTIYTVDNKAPNAVRRVTPGGCEVILATSPSLDGGRGLAVGPNGNLYVGGTASRNLLRIKPNRDIVELMTSPEFLSLTGGLSPWNPVAIALDPDGSHAYVTDQNTPNIVRVNTVTGARTLAYPRPATDLRPTDPVIHPRGLVVDADGNLFVAAGNEKQVLKVPADNGPPIVMLQDDPAEGGIHVVEPYSVRLDADGNLYVAAYQSDNVLKVTPPGLVTQLIGPLDGLDGPRDLAVGDDGTVYVASAETNFAVFRIPAGGSPERIDDATDNDKLKKPKSIAVDHRGNVYVTGELSGTLIRIATQPGTCGNGVVDGPDETCDYAAGEKNCCCTVDCVTHVEGALCGSDNNECTDDVCDGGNLCVHEPNTRPCTDDRTFCDGAEVCRDGVCTHTGDPCLDGGPCDNQCNEMGGGTGDCAVPAYTPCPEDDNPCTTTSCDGNGQCVARADNAGVTCRERADVCDVAETCTGFSTTCPADQVAGPTATCREVAGECDVAEQCDGSSSACPADLFQEPGMPCSAGTCNAAGKCQHGNGGGGTCGDGVVDLPGEECDLGPLNGADQESCCTARCELQPSTYPCRHRDTVCQQDRICGPSTDGTCPADFVSGPNDQICSPAGAATVDGCKLFRCQDGACSQPICSVDVTPIPKRGSRLPQDFSVVCRQAGGAHIERCGAVGYLDTSAILGGGRAHGNSCPELAARYAAGCATVDPLYPYCQLVERKLGKDGILTGKCRRIFDHTPGRRRCIRWLARLGQPECASTARGAAFAPLFRIETTLTSIETPLDEIPTTTVVKVCDRTVCTDAP